MMKKTLFAIVLSVLVLTCVYAGNSSIAVRISPFSFQSVKTNVEKHRSSAGFGVEAGYDYAIWKGLTVGGALKYSNYRYDEHSYHVISLMANAGWTQKIGTTFTLDARFGAALQERMIGEAKALFFALNLYTGAGLVVSPKLTLTAGADFGLAFQKDSRDYSLDAMFGALISL